MCLVRAGPRKPAASSGSELNGSKHHHQSVAENVTFYAADLIGDHAWAHPAPTVFERTRMCKRQWRSHSEHKKSLYRLFPSQEMEFWRAF